MRLLTKIEILFLNKNNISTFGGNYVAPNNLLNETNLDYLIEAVDGHLFGKPMYPEVYQKAGLYLFNIICNHIFTDGNKRTGLDACILFLDYNNYQISESVTNEILTTFIISVASGEQALEQVQNWIKIHSCIKG